MKKQLEQELQQQVKDEDRIFNAHLFLTLNNFEKVTYNHLHNILGLFDVLPNFPFTTSETMRKYCS